MLELALRARIPLIEVATTDPTNIGAILVELKDTKFNKASRFSKGMKQLPKREIFYLFDDVSVVGKGPEQLQSWFETNECVLVRVNGTEHLPMFFDAGVVPTPKSLVKKRLKILHDLKVVTAVDDLMPALNGLTLKEVDWVLRLAMANDAYLSREGILRARQDFFPSRKGLEQVSTEIQDGTYFQDGFLEWWISANVPFLNADDPRLVPRGILFDGPPGTGKTMGAKRIAQAFGVPLFRFDTSQIKDKYVGESEKALAQALACADREAPCVILIDEVEKLFTDASDHGTTTSILGQLLWWMQEHKSRVFMVLTTNDLSKIPAELYRPGRIDTTHTMRGVLRKDARTLAATLVKTYATSVDQTELFNRIDSLFTKVPSIKADTSGIVQINPVPQALVAHEVVDLVKETIMENQK